MDSNYQSQLEGKLSVYKYQTEKLEQQLTQKDEIIKVLTDAVEFYGDECWSPRTVKFSDWCGASDLYLIERKNGLHYEKGGKRARAALEKVKGMGLDER